MELHAFQRNSRSERMATDTRSRVSLPSIVTSPPAHAVVSPNANGRFVPSTSLARHSVAGGPPSSSITPRDRVDDCHAVYSPRPFHSLSTPSTQAHSQSPSPSPLSLSPAQQPHRLSSSPSGSMFSLFSRASSSISMPFRPHDDLIIEVDETSNNGRRYSSILGSPNSNHNALSSLSPRKMSRRPSGGPGGMLGSRRRSSLQFSVGGTSSRVSRLSTKWHQQGMSWHTLGFGSGWWQRSQRPCKSQLRRVCFWCTALGLFGVFFSLVFVLPSDLQRLAPVVVGSLLSFVSALTIMVSFLLQPQNRRYPNELLVYVASCEFGLAVLALAHVMLYCSDTSHNCKALELQTCAITTALEMFLLLASVGWFGCAIVHLFVSVSNPFANYKSQLQRYHFTVWCGSILLSVAVPLVVFSESSQSRYEMSSVEICRAVALHFPLLPVFTSDHDRETRISQWQTLNMEYWGTLFALVVLLVIAAQFILALGWWRSNSGTVIALKARRRMMKRMTTYVHTLNATWLVLLVVFFTYRANPGALAHLAEMSMAAAMSVDTGAASAAATVGINMLDAFFHYTLAAKGFFTCVVWLAVNKHCCAIGHPTLCKGPSGSRDSYSSDDDDGEEEERETAHHFQRGTVAAATAATVRGTGDASSMIQPSRPSIASTARPSSVATPPPGFGAFQGSYSSASSSLSTSSAPASVFASQNNDTLQREIIYYTVCGITKSIRKSARSLLHDEEASHETTTDVPFFQQLLVGGADRESSFVGPAPLPLSVEYHQSPRAYCLTRSNCNYNDFSMSSTTTATTAGINTSMASLVAPSASFSGAQPPLRLDDLISPSHDSALARHREQRFSGTTTTMTRHHQSFTSHASLPPPPPQRFSLYPVSQVPFELFEQEIELQSHRSSDASLSLSPLFANLRRTAHALYHCNHTSKTTNSSAVGTTAAALSARGAAASRHHGPGVDNPRPKLFIDYAPTEFRAIRRAFGLSDESYLASFRSTAKERVSAGSSGAFMFFSGDNALIVKSMKEKECRTLVEMIPTYAEYITSNPASRVIRFFGCHRIRLYGRNFYFVVMSNVLFSPAHTPTITEKYDVKGSWIDRQAKRPQGGDMVTCSECNATYEFARADASTSFPFHVHRPDTILKDLDLKRPLQMGKRVAQELYEQLERDCEFLNAMGIMDYSLLVGVHTCSHPRRHSEHKPWQREFQTSMSFLATSHGDGDGGYDSSDDGSCEDSGGSSSLCGAHLEPIPQDGDDPEEVYFIGIIDILQEWNWEKQLEKLGKTLIGKSSSGISAIAPDAYCQRFKARVAQVLGLNEDENDAIKRIVKPLPIHPAASVSGDGEPLALRLHDDCSGFVQNEQDEEEGEQLWPSVDQAKQEREPSLDEFDAEAIAVSIDLEHGRGSQRM